MATKKTRAKKTSGTAPSDKGCETRDLKADLVDLPYKIKEGKLTKDEANKIIASTAGILKVLEYELKIAHLKRRFDDFEAPSIKVV